MLSHSGGVKSGKDAPKWDSGTEERSEVQESAQPQDEPYFKAPPRNAMAGVLLSDWANGKVTIGEREQVSS